MIGASGGVGTFAVQIAKAFDASVTGVCSTSKVDLVRSTGADEVIDYTRDDSAVSSAPYDVILDIGGNSSLSRLRSVLTPTGTLVIVGGEAPGRILGGNDRQAREFLTGHIETGVVAPVMDRSYPLAEAADAIRHVGQGHARGKVVVAIRTDADRGHANHAPQLLLRSRRHRRRHRHRRRLRPVRHVRRRPDPPSRITDGVRLPVVHLIPVVQAAGCPGKARAGSDELSRCWRRSHRRSCR